MTMILETKKNDSNEGLPSGRLADWPLGWPADQLAGWPARRPAGWLAIWPSGRLAGWPAIWPAGWPAGSGGNRPSPKKNESIVDFLLLFCNLLK